MKADSYESLRPPPCSQLNEFVDLALHSKLCDTFYQKSQFSCAFEKRLSCSLPHAF